MRTALFIMMPLPSHFIAGFNLARQLRLHGYQSVFVGQETLRASVKKEGFEFQSILYATEFQNLTLKTWLGLFLKSIFDKIYTRNRYRQFCREIFSFYNIERTVKPDLFIIDSRLAFYSLLLRPDAGRIIFNTKLSTQPSPGIPPLESTRIAANTVLSRLLSSVDWHIHKKTYYLKTFIRKTALLNCDETYFYKRFSRWNNRNKINSKYCFDSLHPALCLIPKLITYPKVLEYSWKQPHDDEWYVEMSYQRDETPYRNDEYKRIINAVLLRKKTEPGQQYIIYCSLGSMTNALTLRAATYLEKVIDALSEHPCLQLIIATTNKLVKPPSAKNIYLLSKVPQLDLLRHCDLMITHGGLNSMTECLQAGVPMLAAPLIPRSDHCGNVARIEANGFGLKSDMLTDTPKKIRVKVLQILHDPCYRERIAGIRLQTDTERYSALDQLLTKTLAKVS